MPPDIGRDPYQGSVIPSQNPQKRSRSRQSTVEPVRSRSNTTASNVNRPSRSRGSTASIQSSTTQHNPDHQHVAEGFQPYIHPQGGQSHVFHSSPEEMIMRFGEQLSNSNSGSALDPALQENQNSVRPRADIHFQGHELHGHGVPIHGLPHELTQHDLPGDVHPVQYSSIFDGMENQMPDQIVEDNDISEAGHRKRRGTTSSIANDNELRRLLRQYDGYSLQQMATEVQKHEGAGGKSEKVKQVFAMIWLRENCAKNSGSVRRDRVYCCYAEKCGTERVSVLNPASFGKLVRIIFPNVQTRRLGVRGESKYHYVDLSIKDQDPKLGADCDGMLDGNSLATCRKDTDASTRQRSVSISQQPVEISLFPSQITSFSDKLPRLRPFNSDCTCNLSERSCSGAGPDLDMPTMNTQKIIQQMLQFPHPGEQPIIENDTLRLPNIHDYVPLHTDVDVADALAALYRSHCISVIDSFRYCKEKNLFRHFSSLQGTLTVPVHRLLTHPQLAPWITECDWLMYQKMVAFVAPLTTQVVPDRVLKAFGSISRGLIAHIRETFKSHPEHVSSARLVPARIFCHLLKRMLDVNQAATAVAAWLCHTDNRTQMWEDFESLVDPMEAISKANIPSCSVKGAAIILNDHLKDLLTPLENKSPPQVQLFDQELGSQKFTYSSTAADDYTNFPDRWITFILKLAVIFPRHPAQCIIDKVDSLWTCILHRLTLGGAQSFSAWWMSKVFFYEMMVWQAEKGGFMNSTPKLLQESALDAMQGLRGDVTIEPSTNLTREDGLENSASGSLIADHGPRDAGEILSTVDVSFKVNQNSVNLGGTSVGHGIHSESEKPTNSADAHISHNTLNNDDSAIDLGDDSVLLAENKYGDMMASDPADAEGDVVVV